MTLATILLIIALLLFTVDAIGVNGSMSRVNLQSAGLAFLAAAFLVPMV